MRYTTATFSLQNACWGTPKPVNCIRRMQADIPKKTGITNKFQPNDLDKMRLFGISILLLNY